MFLEPTVFGRIEIAKDEVQAGLIPCIERLSFQNAPVR